MKTFLRAFVTCGLGLATLSGVAQKPESLVLISIDGMKPEYVTKADDHGLKIPELRSFLKQGTYADGVQGVVPTVTYPSHTTIVTGVWPAQHGVFNNTTFDPMEEHPGQWYWDFHDIKVPTLYTAADAAGLKTGSVSWPVTIGAPIDYNIAEGAQSERTDLSPQSPYNPSDILAQLGLPAPENTDEFRTREAVGILSKWHPQLMMVHLVLLDHQEHEHGPFSAEANAELEKIDGDVREIEEAARKANPHTRIVIVSDHGFLPVEHHVNLNVAMVENGFVKLAPAKKQRKHPKVESWTAAMWPSGGIATIVVKNNDPAVTAQVAAMLAKLKADPANGIERVLTQDEIAKRGGFPPASFLIDFKDTYSEGANFFGPLVTPAPHTGTHGYLSDRPALRSTFMVKGDGIAKGKDVGVIDMRQIAPTLAELIGVKLPDAKLKPVNVK
ncbi:MAG: ectonucleotide pyrophosphatase/phosphodiesterase [Acidobacteriaceae bacterium]|nr:ectonucleotide pyrophosphatase/phosphodiesterase [Acidobacteriaceae bacterium]